MVSVIPAHLWTCFVIIVSRLAIGNIWQHYWKFMTTLLSLILQFEIYESIKLTSKWTLSTHQPCPSCRKSGERKKWFQSIKHCIDRGFEHWESQSQSWSSSEEWSLIVQFSVFVFVCFSLSVPPQMEDPLQDRRAGCRSSLSASRRQRGTWGQHPAQHLTFYGFTQSPRKQITDT